MKETDLGGERTRRAEAENKAARLSQTLLGLRSQIRDLEAVLATINEQKEELDIKLEVLHAVRPGQHRTLAE